ncbi:MAG TPA: nuclear pore complex subunit [Bacteroidales bacterium]|nr:nuclear pore complex subunit [Bacteroidales bacterium]
METIKIAGNRVLPDIYFDAVKNSFLVAGRSCPEDVSKFYMPLIEWLEEYGKNPNPKTVFDFKLTYYNTASAKMLLSLMQKIEEMHTEGKDVLIRWYFPDDDEDLEEAGEDFKDILEVPFELISYEYED